MTKSKNYLIAYFDRADNVRYCTARGDTEAKAIKASGVSKHKVILIHKKDTYEHASNSK